MKYYYAIFTKTTEAIEVEFPDLPGCVTFGDTWEEAYENAVDVLAGWFAHAEPQFVKEPSFHQQLEHAAGEIVPVPLEEPLLQSYQESKRIHVTFPVSVLKQVDQFRAQYGMKRSTLFLKAVTDYIERHQKSV